MQKQENQEETNVIQFDKPALVKTGFDDKDENWLKSLPIYTIFFARQRGSKNPILEKYMVAQHFKETTELYQLVPTGQQLKFGVISLEFSRGNSLVEDLGTFELVYDGPKTEEIQGQEEQEKKE